MKRKIYISVCFFIITLVIDSGKQIYSQAADTQSFKVIPASTVISDSDYLQTGVTKSGQNIVDTVTGKTLKTINLTPSNTSAEGILKNKEIKLFPNPTSGLLNIEFKNHYDKCYLKLINIVGNVVYAGNLSEIQPGIRTFDFSEFSDGIYFCRFIFPDHEIVFRVIIDK